MEKGEVWVRVRGISGRYMEARPAGERIQIEEIVTGYHGIEQARFVVLDAAGGAQVGRKDQWALRYIETDYVKENT